MRLGLPLALVSVSDTGCHLACKIGVSVTTAALALVADGAAQTQVQFVMMMSLALGAFGGLGAALRQSIKEGKFFWHGIVVHVINMGLVGLCCSMVSLWWLHPVDDSKSYVIIGVAGFMGLVGLPIIEPIAEMIKQLMERVFGEVGKRGE